MGFFDRLLGGISVRAAALSHYKRGLAKGKKRDQYGAIDDYTAAINSPEVPIDIRAMALYNRGLLYASMKDSAKAAEDLRAVIEMEEPLSKIKSAARQTLDRLQRQKGTGVGVPPHGLAQTKESK
jgi:tetratricopeptide (TPR) repeat protein